MFDFSEFTVAIAYLAPSFLGFPPYFQVSLPISMFFLFLAVLRFSISHSYFPFWDCVSFLNGGLH